jgi:hypothetical protein
MPDTLPDSQTHRLCHFKGAPDAHKHVVVPDFVADEVEELREFVKFLFPQRGQDRFKLCRPDILEPRWSVSSHADGVTSTYAAGETPVLAVRNARFRLQSETSPALTLQS